MDYEIQKSDLKLTEENFVPVFSATASIGDLKVESNGILVHDDGYDLNTNGNGSLHSNRSTSGDYVNAVAAVALINSEQKGDENDPDVSESCVSPVECSGMLPHSSGVRTKEMRKWRRIRREFVQGETLNKDSTKMLKRDSSDLANPLLVISEINQKSDDSNSSVDETLQNALHTDIDSSNSSFSKHSNSNSSVKDLDNVDASKKPRGGAINPESEHQSVEDLPSGPSTSAEDDASLSWKSKGRDREISGNCDPLVDCLQMLQSTQEALEQEIEKFGELGKDLQPFDDDSIKTPEFCAASSYEDFGTEIPDALKSKLRNLTRKFEILDIQVEHAKRVVRKKETKIDELVATVNNLKSTNEELQRSIDFHQKNYEDIKADMETEIQYVAIATEQKSVIRNVNKKEAGKMQRRIIKFILCLVLQLIVFIFVFELYISKFLPKTTVVLPT